MKSFVNMSSQGRIVMVSGIAVNRVHPVDGPGNRLHRYRSLGQAQVEGDVCPTADYAHQRDHEKPGFEAMSGALAIHRGL